MNFKEVKLLFENSLRKIVGIIFITLGVLGLFLPFIQGVLLILLGLVLLGSKLARKKLNRLKVHVSKWFS